MARYRGVRGVRNFQKEARELWRFTIGLGAVCCILMIVAAALFFLTRDRTDGAYTVPVWVENDTEDNIFPVSAYAWADDDLPPVIPLYWGAGVFFDTADNKIILPDDVQVAHVWYNYLHYIYTIQFEGIDLPLRNIPLMRYGTLPMYIRQEGDSISFRTRRGAFVRYDTGYVQIFDPREEYRTIVIIDPGHGGVDTGAPSVHGQNAPSESAIVLNIVLNLLDIFDDPEILLVPTRTTDIFIYNDDRYRLANGLGDYFISIHANADGVSRLSQGTLTLYGTADGSHELAYLLQNEIVSALGSQNRGIHYMPELRILRGSDIPVALLELLFMSNPQDAARLADPAIQGLIAETLASAITALPPAR
ncbi:MAG: N-acetylmuramoyl-L-alanine amidase [Defluviitaleaceae bacterium]|nr:N-acetylmuramoyl-L-alanine amidase [Defluviitaleaceae bacterium]